MTTHSYKQSGVTSGIREYTACDDTEFLDGVVYTPYGIVECYSQTGHASLNFVHDAQFWKRFFDKKLTKRGLSTKAHQFAREVAHRRIIGGQ